MVSQHDTYKLKKSRPCKLLNVALMTSMSCFLLSWKAANEDFSKIYVNYVEYSGQKVEKTWEREGVPPMESEDDCDGSGDCEWDARGGEREAVPPMEPKYYCRPGECERDRQGQGGTIRVNDPKLR
jgi:hypothetical protein